VAKFSQDVPLSGVFIKFFPKFLKPIIGPIAVLPNRYHFRQCAKHTVPLVKQRLADMERKRQDPDFKYEEPNDFLTWQIRDAMRRGDPSEQTPEMLSHRVLIVNFAAIHTSTFTVTNALIDLFSASPEKGYLEGIREEAQRVLNEYNGVWTKAGLAKMIRVDSAIRESMRLSGFSSRGLVRKVISDGGVTLEDGLHLGKGTNIGLSAYSVHHDETIFEDPMTYDAFRFSRPREAFATSQDIPIGDLIADETPLANGTATATATEKGENLTEVLKHKNLSMASTSETFLAFGHGRHACPGRFFAANELKLLIAYMVLNYDVKPLPVRPRNTWLGETVLPPMKATVQIRRRKTEVSG
jgi:cytochrome P450